MLVIIIIILYGNLSKRLKSVKRDMRMKMGWLYLLTRGTQRAEGTEYCNRTAAVKEHMYNVTMLLSVI